MESVEDLEDVATVSVSGDRPMAQLIAQAFARVDMDAKVRQAVSQGQGPPPGRQQGQAVKRGGGLAVWLAGGCAEGWWCGVSIAQVGGATLLEDGTLLEDVLEVSAGMRLDRSGMDSPYFITDTERLVGQQATGSRRAGGAGC